MEQTKQCRLERDAINYADWFSAHFDRAYSVYRQMYYPFQYLVRPQYWDNPADCELMYVSISHCVNK